MNFNIVAILNTNFGLEMNYSFEQQKHCLTPRWDRRRYDIASRVDDKFNLHLVDWVHWWNGRFVVRVVHLCFDELARVVRLGPEGGKTMFVSVIHNLFGYLN